MSAPEPPPRRAGSRRKFLLAVLLLVTVGAALQVFEFEWRRVADFLTRVDPGWALLAMATLPIGGFPISPVYVGAGALFGPWLGGLVVMAVTIVHVLATHLLARTVLRRPFARWRAKWNRRLPVVPPGERATLVAMIVIMPGLPYLARNSLLAFSEVPPRVLLGVAVPLYTLRSYVSIFLGDVGREPTPQAVAVLAAVFAVKLALSALLFVRLRSRCERKG